MDSTRFNTIVAGVAVGATEASVDLGVIVERVEAVGAGATVAIEAEGTVSVVDAVEVGSAAIMDVVMEPNRQVAG